MGIQFDGVNPESKAKLDKIVSDGKVTAEEVKGLTPAEKEALAKAIHVKDLPVNGEIKLDSDAPEMPKEEKGFFTKAWDGIKDFAKSKTGKIVLGGVATAGALALTAATFGLRSAGLVWVVGLALTATSCSDIDQNMNLSIEQQNYKALLKALKDKEKADAERHKDIVELLNSLGKGIDEIVNTLLAMGAKLDNVIEVMVTYGANTDKIIELLKAQNKGLTEIFQALGNIQLEQSMQTEFLKKLVDKDNIKIEYLEQILTEVKNGNELQKNENEILNLILTKITNLENNDKEGAELLNQMLAQLNLFIKQEGDMDATTLALLKTIINNQDTIDGNLKTGITEILAKLDKMDQNEKERFEAVIPLLGSLGDKAVEILNAIKEGNALTEQQLQTIIENLGSQGDKLDDIKKLIIKNNEIAQQTQDAVKDMSANMSAEHKAILEAIKNGTAKTDDIQKILVEIRNNTSVLPDMNKKLCVIGTAIGQVLEEVKGMRTETKKGLLEILAKIPNGCHCQPTDLSAIIDLLNKLIDGIQQDPTDKDNSNEGILTDLDKYFK